MDYNQLDCIYNILVFIYKYRSHQKVDEGKNLGLGILYTGYLQKQNPSSGYL